MKFSEVLNLIYQPKGFMVLFEWRKGDGFLRSDHFPEIDEPLIKTEEAAWQFAEMFAEKTKETTVNIYVADSHFNPVPNYEKREIRKYPVK